MSDLICRKSMMRCQTQGMCSPHGGCRDEVTTAKDRQISALIAENERLQLDNSSLRGSCARLGAEHASMARNFKKANRMQYEARSERDQLKAENERLSTENSEIESAAITYIEDMQEAQHENARLTELFTVGMTLDGNLRVYGDWQSIRKTQEMLAERDRLRAEVAGLKTGYEAYERVNAELKAEVEALRQEREGKVLVPVIPSDGLLMSMAVRSDHALGCPGYYDQKGLGRPNNGVSHARMLECALADMRKLHEEVVGTGFYSAEKEAEYLAMAKAVQP